MTTSVEAEGAAQQLRSGVMHGLGLLALVMYGVTYYAIGAAAPAMARDLGTTVSAIFAILGGALLLNALAAPRVGRLVDRLGAGPVLLGGALARAVAVLALGLAPEFWTFALALVAIQLLSQATEYDTAFAAAVQAYGESARASVSLITLWGGLASTAFWPASSLLMETTGWRTMFAIYAALMVAVAVPVALSVIRSAGQARPSHRRAEAAPATEASKADAPARSPAETAKAFVPLALAFSLASVAMGMPVILPPLLDGLGLGAAALMVGIVFGPSQTLGRFFELVFGHRLSPLAVAVIATALLPVSLGVLLAGGANPWTAVIFAVLFGAGAGVSYVVRGTVVLTIFGPAEYASWLGLIARIRLVIAAATPLVLALVLEHFGAAAALALCGATAALATIAFVYVWRRFG